MYVSQTLQYKLLACISLIVYLYIIIIISSHVVAHSPSPNHTCVLMRNGWREPLPDEPLERATPPTGQTEGQTVSVTSVTWPHKLVSVSLK